MSKEKKKKIDVEENDGTFKFFLIIVLIMAVLSIGCCVGVLIGYNMNKDDKIDKEVVEKDDKHKGENVIDDVALKNDIENKIDILSRQQYIGYEDGKEYTNGAIFKKNYKNSEIETKYKMLMVVDDLYIKYMGKSPVTTDYDFGVSFPIDASFATQIDVSEVEKLYVSVFGTKDYKHEKLEFKCPSFIYDEKNSKYYGMSGCGGAQFSYISKYVNRITVEGDKLFAYVSVGSSIYDDSVGRYVYYTDYEGTKSYSGNISDMYNYVNESNYEQFSEYKFIFTKKDGNYSFTEINKIK